MIKKTRNQKIKYLYLLSRSQQKLELAKLFCKKYKLILKTLPVNTKERISSNIKKSAVQNALKKLKKGIEKLKQNNKVFGKSILVSSDVFAYYKKPLLKPKNKKQARDMIKSIANKYVYVHNATAAYFNGIIMTNYSKEKVKISNTIKRNLDKLVSNPNLLKKAGSFSISHVEIIEGSIYNVMGLNIKFIEEFYKLVANRLEHL